MLILSASLLPLLAELRADCPGDAVTALGFVGVWRGGGCGARETLAKVGGEAKEGDEVRWLGFRATGGAAFLDDELFVEVERRRSAGFGRGMGFLLGGWGSLRGGLDMLSLSEVREADGLRGEGILRGPFVTVESDRFVIV